MAQSARSACDTTECLCINGTIHTLDEARPRASVLAARDGALIYVGDDAARARALLSPHAPVLDLQGKTVIPGLTDSHSHIFHEGMKLNQLDLRGQSKQDLLEAVGRAARQTPPGEWITGSGWDQTLWPRQSGGNDWPGKEDLDAVAPDHPVLLQRTDNHSIWVNSRAVELAAVNADTTPLAGGEIVKDARGGVQGIFVGTAMWHIFDRMPPPDDGKRYSNLLAAQAEMLRYGLTSLLEAGLHLTEIDVLKRACEAGDLHLRIHALILAMSNQDGTYLAQGGRVLSGLYGDRLSIGGVKIHADGSLGSRSAWMLEDYADRPGHRGNAFYPDEAILAIMRRAREHGMQVAVHAIGDAALRQVLRAMQTALGPHPGDHRWRIEHMQVTMPEDVAAAMDLGVIPSIQSVGLMADMNIVEERLSRDLLRRSYLWRDMLDGRGLIINGSDCPIESVNPFLGMYAAVTRLNLQGLPEGGWRPEQRLSRLEALKSYTLWPAWAEFKEGRKGSLSPGKVADFAVLDRDLLACPEREIKDVKVLMTFIGGREVYRA